MHICAVIPRMWVAHLSYDGAHLIQTAGVIVNATSAREVRQFGLRIKAVEYVQIKQQFGVSISRCAVKRCSFFRNAQRNRCLRALWVSIFYFIWRKRQS